MALHPLTQAFPEEAKAGETSSEAGPSKRIKTCGASRKPSQVRRGVLSDRTNKRHKTALGARQGIIAWLYRHNYAFKAFYACIFMLDYTVHQMNTYPCACSSAAVPELKKSDYMIFLRPEKTVIPCTHMHALPEFHCSTHSFDVQATLLAVA